MGDELRDRLKRISKVEERRYTLKEILDNPFTSTYYDCQTKQYVFTVLGSIVGVLNPDSKLVFDHIGADTKYHCEKCNHHHCVKCGICHRCGCTTYIRSRAEKKKVKVRREQE